MVLTRMGTEIENISEALGKLSIKNAYEKCAYKKWVKKIKFKNMILYKNYTQKNEFTHIANVELDKDIWQEGKKQGQKRRNTLIKFVPCVNKQIFSRKTEWLYIFTINDYVVKIGGTRTGIRGRTESYLCGHHIVERGKSGDCSKTNGYIYNTFLFYLELGFNIKMYGYELPKSTITLDILGESIKVLAQTFHAYETIFLENFKKKHGFLPPLNDNYDPNYKSKS